MCQCHETVFHYPDGHIQPQRRYLLCSNSVDGNPCGVVELFSRPDQYVPGPGAVISPPSSPPLRGSNREHRVSLIEPNSSSPVSDHASNHARSSSSSSKKTRRSSNDRRVLLEFKLPFRRSRSKKSKDAEKEKSKKPEVVVHHQHHHSYAPRILPAAPDPPPAASYRASGSGSANQAAAGVLSPMLPPSPLSESSGYVSRPLSAEMPYVQNVNPIYEVRVPPSRRSSNPSPQDLGPRGFQDRQQEHGTYNTSRQQRESEIRPVTSAGGNFAQRESEQAAQQDEPDNISQNNELQRALLREEARRQRQRDLRIEDLEQQLTTAHDELASLRSGTFETGRKSGNLKQEAYQPEQQRRQVPKSRPPSPPTPQAASPRQPPVSLQRQQSSAGSSMAASTASAAERNRQTAANTAINTRGYVPTSHQSQPHRSTTRQSDTEQYVRAQQRRHERSHRRDGHHTRQQSHSSRPGPDVPVEIHYTWRADTGPSSRISGGSPYFAGSSSTNRPSFTSVAASPSRGSIDAQNVQTRIAQLESEIMTLRRIRHGIEDDMIDRMEADARADAAHRERERRRLSTNDRPSSSTRMPWDRSPPTANDASSPASPSRDAESSWTQRLHRTRETSNDLRGMFEKVGLGLRNVRPKDQDANADQEEPIPLKASGERERRFY